MEQIILVNEHDEAIGSQEKIKAHELAQLHRAFSVFIYRVMDGNVEILMQQRHPDKYHCGGLWTNTCCGHPRPGEDTVAAGERRLFEEMGIKETLSEVGVFTYKSIFDNGLTEHEIDHVLIGTLDQEDFTINPTEAVDCQWVDVNELNAAIMEQPDQYTPWLLPALEHFRTKPLNQQA